MSGGRVLTAPTFLALTAGPISRELEAQEWYCLSFEGVVRA